MNTISYFIDGVWYYKTGWFGCQLSSAENDIKKGDIRIILDRIMYAARIDKKFLIKNWVTWTLIKPSSEDIRALYADMEKIS